MQILGLQEDYSSDESFRMLCRKTMVLALMLEEQVVNIFHEIKTAANQLLVDRTKALITSVCQDRSG
jgi:hypothetical protein